MSRAWPKTALVVLATAALVAGCASVDPQDFNALQAQVARDQARLRDLTKRVDQMQQTIETTRGPQANLVADMAYMRQELARLNGRIDETSQMLNQGGGELGQRLERVESYLGLTPSAGGGPESSPPPMAAPAPTPAPAPAKPAAPPREEPQAVTAEAIYELGQRLYKQKSYDAARDRFEELIKKHPKDKLVENAQFWVGETYYAQKRYEEAILAYNQLVKKWPDGAKAPGALLKQGMAFNELGDKRTAKIVLGKLVKSYPRSPEAKSAEKLMEKMP